LIRCHGLFRHILQICNIGRDRFRRRFDGEVEAAIGVERVRERRETGKGMKALEKQRVNIGTWVPWKIHTRREEEKEARVSVSVSNAFVGFKFQILRAILLGLGLWN